MITATGNIQGANLVTGGALSVTGNANIGNIGTAGLITATGNITAPNFIGNLANGTSIVGISTTNGNVGITAGSSSWTFGTDGDLTIPGNIVIDTGIDGNIESDGNINLISNGNTWTFGDDGNLTLPDTSQVVGALTSNFIGTIAGTTLTVTGATPGTIAWEQAIEGPGVAADTFIITQLTGTSGGNGTYSVTVSQNVGPVIMNVSAMYLNSSLKLGVNHAIYQQDEDDSSLYNFLIGIEAQEATIHIGDINTNGVCIPNDKEYKVHSNLNPGTFMAVAKVNANDEVILSSGNGANTLIRVGGDSNVGGYGLKLNNGGQGLMPVGLRIGDNTNSSIFAAPLEVGSILGSAANNQSSPGGVALPTYRGTGTVIANDEWGSYIYGSRYRGTINTPLPVKNGDWLMEFGATAFDGTNNNGGGEIAIRVDGVVSGTNNPSKIEFYNTLSGANVQSLGMVLDSSQKLSVTGNIQGANLVTGGVLSVTGNANIGNIGTGIVTATGNITGANLVTGGLITATGNITGANISTAGNISGNTNGFVIGYLNIPQVAASNTTIGLTDAGKHYYSTSTGNFTLTVPNNTTTSFATGTAISIVVQSTGNVLVNAASGVTLYMAGNSTAANRVVSNYGMATIMKVATDTWMISGTGVA